jgi:hypothetical protein
VNGVLVARNIEIGQHATPGVPEQGNLPAWKTVPQVSHDVMYIVDIPIDTMAAVGHARGLHDAPLMQIDHNELIF